MTGLGFRLAVPVAAVVLIGLAVVDVAFVFWGQSRLNQQRVVELRAAALETALAAVHESTVSQARLAALAAEHRATLTLVAPSGTTLSSASPPPSLPDFSGQEHVVAGGVEHVVVRPAAGSPWALVVAARPLQVGEVLGWQPSVLLFLAVVAASMVALALVFMRRAVIAPVERMTQLVGAADRDGLSRFGLEASDTFGRLSSAIVGMTQRIDTDRQRISDQLEELRAAHTELSSTQHQLVRAERLAVVGQLAAGLAHEIGNPLAVLSGYMDVLDDPELPAEDRSDAFVHMKRELDRIHAIMRDLLDFSRAPASAVGSGDVREALAHVEKLLRPQERFRSIDVQIVAPDAVAEVPLEPNALTQVLLNLLFNAADALDGTGTVRISVERDGDRVVVLVDDSGTGIPAEVKATIFEPFFTTKAAGEGTGLGLAVCDHIVSSVGGEISVDDDSALGGARFRITLPVAGAPER